MCVLIALNIQSHYICASVCFMLNSYCILQHVQIIWNRKTVHPKVTEKGMFQMMRLFLFVWNHGSKVSATVDELYLTKVQCKFRTLGKNQVHQDIQIEKSVTGYPRISCTLLSSLSSQNGVTSKWCHLKMVSPGKVKVAIFGDAK